MEVQAISRNVRISPRKVRIVANLVRGKKAGEAISILRNTHKAASIVVEKPSGAPWQMQKTITI